MSRSPSWPLIALLVIYSAPAAAQAGEATYDPFAQIQWREGPATVQIGTQSEVAVPGNCRFTGRTGARDFMVATENPPSGKELGVMLCESAGGEMWFVVFTFNDSGLVRDTDAGELDAGAILASIRKGNDASNAERRNRGWATLDIHGWVSEPYYDVQTNNLTWAIEAFSAGDATVNHSVRLLGRSGVMHADLVADPRELATLVPEFDEIIATHAFIPGQRYSEWREGDKLAGYGLTALVAGGAGVALAKGGLLGFLGKFFKLIVAGVVGVLAWLGSLFSRKKASPHEEDRA